MDSNRLRYFYNNKWIYNSKILLAPIAHKFTTSADACQTILREARYIQEVHRIKDYRTAVLFLLISLKMTGRSFFPVAP